MTPQQLLAALSDLGWTQRRFAMILGRHYNKVNDWCTGKVRIPAYAAHTVKTALGMRKAIQAHQELYDALFPEKK